MIGLRELALVATVVLVLYGRSGVLKSRQFQTIRPWITPVRRPSGRSAKRDGHGPVAIDRGYRVLAAIGPTSSPSCWRAIVSSGF